MLHKSEEEAFLQARESMIRTQLAARGIHDQAVLTAMMNIKRHLFVPASHSAEAYADRALPINAGPLLWPICSRRSSSKQQIVSLR